MSALVGAKKAVVKQVIGLLAVDGVLHQVMGPPAL